MKKQRSTKRALLLSALALLMCVSMLIGSTFAWFTDSVTSTGNKIVSGKLDVDLVDAADISLENETLEFVDENGAVLSNILWEPGCTYTLEPVKVMNRGNLWLKYEIVISGLEGNAKLLEAIEWTVEGAALKGSLAPNASTEALKITGHIKEEAGNEYQNLTIDGVSITVYATQYTYEKDSFSNQYDATADADTWDGTADTSWYNDTDAEFTFTTAEQLAGLANLVDGGNTFAGKTIKLGKDLNLYAKDASGERISFDPIGYGYNTVFKGTFDGQDHTIFNLYQNGWALGLDYSTEGGGLFASVVDATFKNLTIDSAEIVMECIDMGALVGYSYGNSSYENITVSNSVVANYNRYTGGVIGEANGTQTFKNVDVIDTTVSALWGTYDAACGGIIGGKWGDAKLTFEDCDVSAKLDVFNDACSNYQYYNYHLCGMLIGMTEEVTDDAASASYLTCNNCTVTYGDWVNYTYCESESYGKGSYAAPDEWKYKRVQAGYATDGVDPNHTHDTDESHEELFVFDQLFGGDKGVRGGKTHTGVTVNYN